MKRFPLWTVAALAIVSAFGVSPRTAASAVEALRELVPATPTTEIPVAATAPAQVDIVEPALKPPSTWAYSPTVITVKVGTTVTWTNSGAVVHTVTADDGKAFDSGNMAPKVAFSFTPTAPGTFPYHCKYHPWMKGTLIVQP